ncbi:MAG: TetR/AcrR family transcriptional regulator [Planctomycetaceae bacterium]|nr:TetR/AcrR family transcriptional regulator [Planctomycetaceae bacterium]
MSDSQIALLEPKSRVNRADKRVARTKKKLLTAALEVFSECGVDAATIEDITQRADLGKGTFYRHFSDKAEITACLVEEALEKLKMQLDSKSNVSNFEEMLEHIVNVHYKFFQENTEEFILLFQGRLFLKLDRQITEQMEGPFNGYLEYIENLISPFISEKVELVRIRRFACAVAGFVFGFFSFAMIGMESQEVENGIKSLRQSFVKSLSLFLVQ